MSNKGLGKTNEMNDKVDFVKLNKTDERKILNKENNFLKVFINGFMKNIIKSDEENEKSDVEKKSNNKLYKISEMENNDTEKNLIEKITNNQDSLMMLNKKKINSSLDTKKNSDFSGINFFNKKKGKNKSTIEDNIKSNYIPEEEKIKENKKLYPDIENSIYDKSFNLRKTFNSNTVINDSFDNKNIEENKLLFNEINNQNIKTEPKNKKFFNPDFKSTSYKKKLQKSNYSLLNFKPSNKLDEISENKTESKTKIIRSLTDNNISQDDNQNSKGNNFSKSLLSKKSLNIKRLKTTNIMNLKPDEKRDLNKLKNELKNNLFLKYTKEEINSTQNLREKSRYVKKLGKVYDSLSDEEFDGKDNKILINPFSNTRYFIDFLVMIVVIYSVCYLPIRMIFSSKKSLNLCGLEIICDSIMILDFMSGFISGYYDFEENYIMRRNSMIKHYLRTYFFVDIISSIPFNSQIEMYIYYNEDSGIKKSSMYMKNKPEIINEFLDYNEKKIYRLLKIIRLLKFFKFISKNSIIESIKDKLNFTSSVSAAVNRMIFFLFYFLIISHILSCIFIFLGSLAIPNWIKYVNLQDSDFSDIYLASLYFNHTTIFTIGYGDVLSRNMFERSYNVILMVVGIMIYSFAVTSISNIIQQRDDSTKIYMKNMDYLNELNMKYKIRKPLFDKIARSLKYDKNANKKDKTELLKELPIMLRNEMILIMYENIINSFIFFKNFSNVEFIVRAILYFKPVRSLKNEILVKEGDFIEEIIFIKKGILCLETTIHMKNSEKNFKNNLNKSNKNVNIFQQEISQKIKIIEIRRNEHFGDVLIFLNERSPLTVKTKSKYAELFLMKKLDLIQLTTEFPEIFEQIYIKSSYNMFQIKKCIQKTKKFYFNQINSEFIQTPKISLNTRNKLSSSEILGRKSRRNSLDQFSKKSSKKKIISINSNNFRKSNEFFVNCEDSEDSGTINFQSKKINPVNISLSVLEENLEENDNDSKYVTQRIMKNNIPIKNPQLKESKIFESKNTISELDIDLEDQERIKIKEKNQQINFENFNNEDNNETEIINFKIDDKNLQNFFNDNFFEGNNSNKKIDNFDFSHKENYKNNAAPIFYNFNINNSYKINNNKNIIIKKNDSILSDTEKSKKSFDSKTISYLNLTNLYPIDDKIIQSVSQFTIFSNPNNSINMSTSVLSNREKKNNKKKIFRKNSSNEYFQNYNLTTNEKYEENIKMQNKSLNNLLDFKQNKNSEIENSFEIKEVKSTRQTIVKSLSPFNLRPHSEIALQGKSKSFEKNKKMKNIKIDDFTKSFNLNHLKLNIKNSLKEKKIKLKSKKSEENSVKINHPYDLKNNNENKIYSNKSPNKLKQISQNIIRTTINVNNPLNFYSDLMKDILIKKKKAKILIIKDDQSKSIKRLDNIMKKLKIK